MSIISQHCDTETAIVEQFMQATKGTALYELRRLVQEVNATFGLRVTKITDTDRIKPRVHLVTPDGFDCGTASVIKEGNRDGEDVYRYRVTLPTIKKQKASANSDRDTRDSVSIATLIRSIKTNKEEPTSERLLATLQDGMKYTMRAVANAGRGKPHLTYGSDTAVAVTRFVLGLDSDLPNMYISEIQNMFDKFQSDMQLFEAANNDYARYARGVTLVGISYSGNKPHYLVADATFNTQKSHFELQGGMKRYNSLADSPLAATAVMIKTYMQGQPHYEKNNDLGLIWNDKFYQEIDIATGYCNRDHLWVAIPKNGQ